MLALTVSSCAPEHTWRESHLHLMSDLFSNYTKETRPCEDGRPTVVDVMMTPGVLIDLDEETEAAQMQIVIQFS